MKIQKENKNIFFGGGRGGGGQDECDCSFCEDSKKNIFWGVGGGGGVGLRVRVDVNKEVKFL